MSNGLTPKIDNIGKTIAADTLLQALTILVAPSFNSRLTAAAVNAPSSSRDFEP